MGPREKKTKDSHEINEDSRSKASSDRDESRARNDEVQQMDYQKIVVPGSTSEDSDTTTDEDDDDNDEDDDDEGNAGAKNTKKDSSRRLLRSELNGVSC